MNAARSWARLRALLPFALAALVGLWAHSPAVRCPRAVDDFAHTAMLDGSWPLRRAPWDLYNFADGSESDVRALASRGALPWWSHPRLSFRFARPLTSLTLALDHALFGASARGPHLHSLAWWAACLIACSLLFSQVISRRAAPLAAALFAADGAHTLPLGWLANRSFLVAAALGLFGLWRFDRYARGGPLRDGALAAALFSLSLAGGEYALTVLAYAAAHTALSPRREAESLRERLRRAWPWLAPLALWALAYRAGGYGSAHSDAYLDPLRNSWDFLVNAPERLAAHLGELWFGAPATDAPPLGLSSLHARALGALGLAGIAVLLWALRAIPQSLRWLAAGSAIALVPALSAFGTTRLQLSAQVGAAAVVATLFVRAFESLADRRERARVAPWLAAGPALALIVIHLAMSPVRARVAAAHMCAGHERVASAVRGARIEREGLSRARVVLVAAPDGQTLMYAPWIWQSAGIPMPRAFTGLTVTPGIYRLRRTARDVLALEAFSGPWLLDRPEAMFRESRARLRSGDRISLDGLEITVDNARPPGLRRVSFRFTEPTLDSGDVRLLLLDRAGTREVPLPAVGATLPVPAPELPER